MDPQLHDPNLPPPKSGMGFAITALVCGLAGLFLFGIILGPIAIIFGALGLAAAKKNPVGAGKSASIAGLVLGIIDMLWVMISIASVVR